MENISFIRTEKFIGSFPILFTDIHTIFRLRYVEGLRCIEMSCQGITKLNVDEGCYTYGISSCIGGLQYNNGAYSVFHSNGWDLPDDAFRNVDEGILFTGHAETWNEYGSRLEENGNNFIFRPGLDFEAWQGDPWYTVYAAIFAFLPKALITNVTPGLYVAFTD